MDPRTVRFFSVAITTFIPWLISLAALGAMAVLPRPVFVLIHYLLDVLLFGVAFTIYFRGHKKADPFLVMGIAILCLVAFQVIFFGFFYEGERWFLTYVDWLVPLFLVSSTIYATGKFLK